jgi:hypothetical protein
MNPHADRDRSENRAAESVYLPAGGDERPEPTGNATDVVSDVLRRRVAKALAGYFDWLDNAVAVESPDATHALTGPHSDADRVNAYADALCAALTPDFSSDADWRPMARAVIALADREQAPLHEEIERLQRDAQREFDLGTEWVGRAEAAEAMLNDASATIERANENSDAWRFAAKQNEARADEAESKVAALEGEVERLRNDHLYSTSKAVEFRVRAEDAERDLADERAKVAAIEALRDELAAIGGAWVGPWVYSMNMLERLEAALDGGA